MYVYKQFIRTDSRSVESVYYQVGFYDPDKNWCIESSCSNAIAAQRKVHYLNGGDNKPF